MNNEVVKKRLIKEVLKEVEKLSSQFNGQKNPNHLITNFRQLHEVIWKLYYNIWQKNFQYNSVITLEELKEIHEDYHQKVLSLNKKSKLHS